MKLLTLIIAVILMSVFSESIYAESQSVEMKEIDVTGIIDQELAQIEREHEEVKLFNRNGTKKVEKFTKTQKLLSELIPKQIELAKGRKKYYQMIDAKNKYLNCISSKDADDCTDLKEDLDKLNISTSYQMEINQTRIKPDSLYGIMQCSSVTKEAFPGFKAYIALDITINPNGSVQKILVDSDESDMTHELSMFTKCVVHFAYKLNFENSSGKEIRINKTFIFGRE